MGLEAWPPTEPHDHGRRRTVSAASAPDVSLVLNIHNESGYLRRTLMSLEAATRYAQAQGITVELVAVLDRASPPTSDWIRAYDFRAFDTHQVCAVDNGSLGLSRNDGIALARGQYVGLCDADDLVSYDFYAEHYALARAAGRKTILVPQYCFAFGDNAHIGEFFGTDRVSTLAFFGYHPYISRIFAHRSLFELLQVRDVRLTDGFAYEDWHFHCEAIAHGYRFATVKGVVFYYRQRRHSLLRQADARSNRRIPFSRFHEPDSFLKTCAEDYAKFVMDGHTPPSHSVSESFLASGRSVEVTRAANEIDPAIDISRIGELPVYSNLSGDVGLGAKYYKLCQRISGLRFTDVVLLSRRAARTTEVDRYIFSVLDGIKELHPEATFLVLTAQPSDGDHRLPTLPEGSVWLDLARYSDGCDEEDVYTLALRIMQGVSQDGRLHIAPSQFAVGFFRRYGRLVGNVRYYYRFFDPVLRRHGLWFKDGDAFDFLSECGEHLHVIVTSNDAIAGHDRARLDALSSKIHTLYARCDAAAETARTGRTRRFLWVSPPDAQCRPDLLPAVALRLHQQIPDARLDVFHQAADGRDIAHLCASHQNLVFGGECTALQVLQPDRYDALLYFPTADGLPHVILQALALGLLVVAPDVGGIREAVTSDTGFLVENVADEPGLVDAIIRAVAQASDADAAPQRRAMREAGRALIGTRHTRDVFLARLSELLRLNGETGAPVQRVGASPRP
jgi:glycosyltransferase involved in cell wall biosynthesis